MLGVGLRKLCPQDSFGYAFRRKKTVRKSTPGGCKTGPRGVQNGLRDAVSGRPWGGALGTLLALLAPSWGPPGASRAAPGRLLGVILEPPKG